jgi:peptidoglycan hydrolase-like protein with peptidoglycan-binding domain
MNNYINDYYGTATRAAMIKFQQEHNLKADGIVGPATRTVINQMLNS